MMNHKKQYPSLTPTGVFKRMSLLAAFGVLAFPLTSSAQVEHVVLEVEDSLGVPAIQAIISSCLGELVFLSGTVRLTFDDGVLTHVNWAGITGTTSDGDTFVGGSGVGGNQSNLTLAEVGAGADSRQIHLSIVDGALTVVCHNN